MPVNVCSSVVGSLRTCGGPRFIWCLLLLLSTLFLRSDHSLEQELAVWALLAVQQTARVRLSPRPMLGLHMRVAVLCDSFPCVSLLLST